MSKVRPVGLLRPTFRFGVAPPLVISILYIYIHTDLWPPMLERVFCVAVTESIFFSLTNP